MVNISNTMHGLEKIRGTILKIITISKNLINIYFEWELLWQLAKKDGIQGRNKNVNQGIIYSNLGCKR
jgi:hypothetical protein